MKVRVQEREWELEILEHSGDDLVLCVDGERIEANARRTPDGGWSILLDGNSWEVWVEDQTGTGGPTSRIVAVGADLLRVDIEDPRTYIPSGGAGAHQEGWTEVRAPMPGKVVAVLAREGEEVAAGQGLVVVEAMKMENEFTSPKAGIVAQVPVEAGQAVEAGALLAAVE